MSAENVDVVRALFEAFQRGDERALVAMADPDVEIKPAWDSMSVDVARGHEEFLKFWREWPDFWDAYSLQPCRFIDSGERVVVVLQERARTRPGAAEVKDEFAHVWTLRGRKVTRVDLYNDKGDAFRAAGVED
jgi:ketosteroid isomerase-like protein